MLCTVWSEAMHSGGIMLCTVWSEAMYSGERMLCAVCSETAQWRDYVMHSVE